MLLKPYYKMKTTVRIAQLTEVPFDFCIGNILKIHGVCERNPYNRGSE